MTTHYKFISLIFLFVVNITFAQIVKRPSYKLETGASLSSGQSPFWFVSDQYGLIKPDQFNGWLRTKVFTKIDPSKKIDYDYGLEIVNRYNSQYDLYIHQAYVRVKLWFINIQGGSLEEKFGNQDSCLSSGGLLWSGNARPMPKITINVPKYTAVPFTKGYLEFKGGISHGWFDKNSLIKNFWLHHKYLYVQLGGKLPIHVHFGLHHFAQWGGETKDSTIGKLPSKFGDFVKVFKAESGEGASQTIWSEYANRIGNHIGSRNFGLDVDFKKVKTGLYWQTIFEDGSGKAYRNISDGLWGFYLHRLKKGLFKGFVYEFIKTTDQSGPSHDPTLTFPRGGGNDNYFNHWIYVKGWTYHDMTIGTPFITSPVFMHGGPQLMQGLYLKNNKVKAHHIGIDGEYKNLYYRVFYSYSLNYGTNAELFSEVRNQHSILIKTVIANVLPWHLDLGLNLGFDKGEMYGNNVGLMITLTKTGAF